MLLYINDKGLAARYGTHRTWAWRLAKEDPTFPKPVKLSAGCTRWVLSEVEAWEAARRGGVK